MSIGYAIELAIIDSIVAAGLGGIVLGRRLRRRDLRRAQLKRIRMYQA